MCLYDQYSHAINNIHASTLRELHAKNSRLGGFSDIFPMIHSRGFSASGSGVDIGADDGTPGLPRRWSHSEAGKSIKLREGGSGMRLLRH